MKVLLTILCVIGCAEAELSSFLTQAEDEKEATTDQPIVNAGKLNKSELEPEPEAEPEVEPEAEPPFSVPKSWSKCWVSGRMSSALAISIKTAADTESLPIVRGSTEAVKFSIVNPVAEGTCQAHWGNLLAVQPGDDLWDLAAYMSSNNPDVEVVVSCAADVTPDCRCFAMTYDDSLNIGIGMCQNQTCSGEECTWGDVYDMNMNAPTSIIPMAKECAPMRKLSKQWGIWAIQQGEALVEDTTGGDKCRIDLEPFEPKPIDTYWYGHEARDWAVVTCSEKITATTSCRCYSNLFKSPSQIDARSGQYTFNNCMKCIDDNCQRVATF